MPALPPQEPAYQGAAVFGYPDYRRDRAGILPARLASLPALHRGIRAATGSLTQPAQPRTPILELLALVDILIVFHGADSAQ